MDDQREASLLCTRYRRPREEAARGRERDNKLDLSRRIKAMEEKERASREKSERRAQIERTAMEESDRRGREKLAALRAKE